MKKFVIILPIVFLLSGCLSTPVKRTFPEVPQALLASCPDLKQIEPTDKLSEVIKVVSDNYGTYHECRIAVETWKEWYKIQKDIFNSVK
jgi:hypothetical protein